MSSDHVYAPGEARSAVWRRRTGRLAPPAAAALIIALAAAPQARAVSPGMGITVQAGTTGIGLGYDVALSPRFTARIGYSGFNDDHSVNTSDVDYSGTLKLSMVTGIVDWYAFGGGFHLSAGVVGNGTRLDVRGQPAAGGSYTINGHSYTGGDVGALTGRLKFGNAVSPYVGLGWGNPVGLKHHLHFLVDIGAIYGGTPDVALDAVCGPAAPAGGLDLGRCVQVRGNAWDTRAGALRSWINQHRM